MGGKTSLVRVTLASVAIPLISHWPRPGAAMARGVLLNEKLKLIRLLGGKALLPFFGEYAKGHVTIARPKLSLNRAQQR